MSWLITVHSDCGHPNVACGEGRIILVLTVSRYKFNGLYTGGEERIVLVPCQQILHTAVLVASLFDAINLTTTYQCLCIKNNMAYYKLAQAIQ